MRITDSPVERKEDDERLPMWAPMYIKPSPSLLLCSISRENFSCHSSMKKVEISNHQTTEHYFSNTAF